MKKSIYVSVCLSKTYFFPFKCQLHKSSYSLEFLTFQDKVENNNIARNRKINSSKSNRSQNGFNREGVFEASVRKENREAVAARRQVTVTSAAVKSVASFAPWVTCRM